MCRDGLCAVLIYFFKQKTAYEMRISDWSSDVCSSDLGDAAAPPDARTDEVAHLRLRYKRPGEDDSRLITTPIARSSLRTAPSDTLRFAATVAAYADGLRGGSRIGDWGDRKSTRLNSSH